MDLAEIRKKAQQEKETDEEPRGAEMPPPESRSMESIDQLLEWPAQEEELHPPIVVGGSVTGADVPSPRQVTSSSDPIAVLLEGRRNSVSDIEGPGSDSKESDVADGNILELLCFRIDREEYAINILDIKEIIKPREVTEVPRVPSFISGIISLRGIIIPVFDMHARLGLQHASDTGKERVVVVRSAGELFGICVDEVKQVARIYNSGIEPTPSVLDGIDREFVTGIGRVDGRMLILLNLENLLDVSLM